MLLFDSHAHLQYGACAANQEHGVQLRGKARRRRARGGASEATQRRKESKAEKKGEDASERKIPTARIPDSRAPTPLQKMVKL
jgi:hypothetical protein